MMQLKDLRKSLEELQAEGQSVRMNFVSTGLQPADVMIQVRADIELTEAKITGAISSIQRTNAEILHLQDFQEQTVREIDALSREKEVLCNHRFEKSSFLITVFETSAQAEETRISGRIADYAHTLFRGSYSQNTGKGGPSVSLGAIASDELARQQHEREIGQPLKEGIAAITSRIEVSTEHDLVCCC